MYRDSLSDWMIAKFGHWLLKNDQPLRNYLCDFDQISHDIRAGDVILIEGRNRVSRIIQLITKSPWSHAALYIGRPNQILNAHSRQIVKEYCEPLTHPQLIIESEIGEGTIVSPLTKYQADHIRILRPQGLSIEDIQKLIAFAISRLGRQYSLKHVFDLARFLFPWGLWPRQWRSILFQHNALQPTEDICSSMIADAFHSIDYPILPLVAQNEMNEYELTKRNPRLYTPSDFDYSPYFNVVKYPIFKLGRDLKARDLPWKQPDSS